MGISSSYLQPPPNHASWFTVDLQGTLLPSGWMTQAVWIVLAFALCASVDAIE